MTLINYSDERMNLELAEKHRKCVNALMDQGFTQDQAVQLESTTNLTQAVWTAAKALEDIAAALPKKPTSNSHSI